MQRYLWRVKVWDEKGKASVWSKTSEFRIAPDKKFLDGKWIGAVSYEQAALPAGRNYTYDKWKKPEVKEAWERVDSMASRSILLRDEFDLPKKIADATVYVCGLGHYELSVNGTKVGDGEFTPLWSDYDKTVYYNTYDVTPLVRVGENAIGVLLGNGFYNVVRGSRYSKLQIGFGPETLSLKCSCVTPTALRRLFRLTTPGNMTSVPSPSTPCMAARTMMLASNSPDGISPVSTTRNGNLWWFSARRKVSLRPRWLLR